MLFGPPSRAVVIMKGLTQRDLHTDLFSTEKSKGPDFSEPLQIGLQAMLNSWALPIWGYYVASPVGF